MALNNTLDRPFVRDPEQMRDVIEQLSESGYDLAKLDELKATVDQRKDLADRLHTIDPSLNGNVDHLIEDLALMRQEVAAKKEWSVWEYIKSVPGRVWGVIKRHPKTTILVTTVALAAAAYFSGYGAIAINYIREWIMEKFGFLGVEQATEAARQAAEKLGGAVETAKDTLGTAAETMKDALPGVPSVPDIPVPTPSVPVPPSGPVTPGTVEELDQLFRNLGGT